MKTKLILLLGTLVLFGCSTNQKFDCPYKNGIRCQRLSDIDKEIDSKQQRVQIWVGPYESEEGVHHHHSMLSFSLKPARRIEHK